MKDQEILKKAVQKAVDGGWKAYGRKKWEVRLGYFYTPDGVEYYAPYLMFDNESSLRLYQLIFDHEFAKALWGEMWAYFTEGRSGDTIGGNFINWKGHLANMAVADDPIKYLEQNL